MKTEFAMRAPSCYFPSLYHSLICTRIAWLSLLNPDLPLNIYDPLPLSCGTKLIEDDWLFPGCSDPALANRQQEVEEELAQAHGLKSRKPKYFTPRNLQV